MRSAVGQMDEMHDFKGYYCGRCHTYTRIYRDETGGFSGKCPKCGIKLILDEASAEGRFFFSGGRNVRPLNIWDSYLKRKIIGTVEAGTAANVLETKVYNGVTWYHVRVGRLDGWISGTFIRHLR
jgi:hypothetical protein